MTDTPSVRPRIVINCIYYAVAISFFLYVFYYYWTSVGGPTLLALTLIPITFVLFTLQALRDERSLSASAALRELRHRGGLLRLLAAPSPTTCTPNTRRSAPRVPGCGTPPTSSSVRVMTALVMEYARKRHMPLFVLNIVLILYAVYGYMVPGMFHHAGLSWERVRHRHEHRNGDRHLLQPAAARAHRGRFVPAGPEPADRLRLHRFAFARDQAGRHPLPARAAAVGGDRLDVRRHRQRQRRSQCHHHWLGHHSRHDRRRHAAGDRGGDRVGLVAGRAVHAAGDGDLRLPDGRVPGQGLFRRGGARAGCRP